jgi:hypothetical protein
MNCRLPVWLVCAVLIVSLTVSSAARRRAGRTATLTVDVTALDATGASIAGLAATDVEVLVDGVAVPVRLSRRHHRS